MVRIGLLGILIVISVMIYMIFFDKLISLAVTTGSTNIARFSAKLAVEADDVALIEKLVSRSKLAPVGYEEGVLIRKLIEDGEDVDAVNSRNGNTALISAAKKLDIEAMRFFLSKGANANSMNINGSTAAILVCAQLPELALDALKILFENGADLSLENLEGHSCRSLALTRSHQMITSNSGPDPVLEFLDNPHK